MLGLSSKFVKYFLKFSILFYTLYHVFDVLDKLQNVRWPGLICRKDEAETRHWCYLPCYHHWPRSMLRSHPALTHQHTDTRAAAEEFYTKVKNNVSSVHGENLDLQASSLWIKYEHLFSNCFHYHRSLNPLTSINHCGGRLPVRKADLKALRLFVEATR